MKFVYWLYKNTKNSTRNTMMCVFLRTQKGITNSPFILPWSNEMLPCVDSWYRRFMMLSCGPTFDTNRCTVYARGKARDLDIQVEAIPQKPSRSELLRCIPEALWWVQNLVFLERISDASEALRWSWWFWRKTNLNF